MRLVLSLLLAVLLTVPAYAETPIAGGTTIDPPSQTVEVSADYIESQPMEQPVVSTPEGSEPEPGEAAPSVPSSEADLSSSSESGTVSSSEAVSEGSGTVPSIPVLGETQTPGAEIPESPELITYLDTIAQLQVFHAALMCTVLGVLLVRMFKR